MLVTLVLLDKHIGDPQFPIPAPRSGWEGARGNRDESTYRDLKRPKTGNGNTRMHRYFIFCKIGAAAGI